MANYGQQGREFLESSRFNGWCQICHPIFRKELFPLNLVANIYLKDMTQWSLQFHQDKIRNSMPKERVDWRYFLNPLTLRRLKEEDCSKFKVNLCVFVRVLLRNRTYRMNIHRSGDYNYYNDSRTVVQLVQQWLPSSCWVHGTVCLSWSSVCTRIPKKKL